MEINKAAIITFTSLQMIICLVCCSRCAYALFRKYCCKNSIGAGVGPSDIQNTKTEEPHMRFHTIHPIATP